MFRNGTLLAALAITAMLAAPAAAQDEKPDWAALLSAKADTVVSVSMTAALPLSQTAMIRPMAVAEASAGSSLCSSIDCAPWRIFE